MGSNPYLRKIKTPTTDVVGVFMAEDEGFEPPQTESESGVLPLHKSSIKVSYLRQFVTEQSSFDLFSFRNELSVATRHWWRQQDSNL